MSLREQISEGVRAVVAAMKREPYYNPQAGPLPKDMWSIQSLEKGKVTLKKVPVPVPKDGEVLVKVHYSPVHPHDVNFAMNFVNYGDEPKLPHGNGTEGSGFIVASGGGIMGHYHSRMMTKVCALASTPQVWSEYAVTSLEQTMPLDEKMSLKKGAACLINPPTAVTMLTLAKEGGHKALVISPASSQVGLQTVRAASKFGLQTVCIVRGEKNVQKVKEQANHPEDLIIRNDVNTFQEDLKKAIEKTGATISFDAIAGKLSSQIYSCMPETSTVYYFGNIGGEGVPDELQGKEDDPKKPFMLLHAPRWMEKVPGRKKKIYDEVSKWVGGELSTEFTQEIELTDQTLVDTINALGESYKSGKVLIRMPDSMTAAPHE